MEILNRLKKSTTNTKLRQKEFEDTKGGVVRIRKSKKNRQHKRTKYKRTNNDLQNIHNIALKYLDIFQKKNNKANDIDFLIIIEVETIK